MKTQKINEEINNEPKCNIYEPVSGQYIQTTNPLLLLGLKKN